MALGTTTVIGRFISPDTIIPDFGSPQSLNRYSYVFDNPVKYRDPSGHMPPDDDPRAGMIDFRVGVGAGAIDTLAGLVDLGKGVVGLAFSEENRDTFANNVGFIAAHPVETAGAMLQSVVKPIEEDWESGHEERAVGRGFFEVASTVVGSRGITKAGKLRELASFGRAAEAGVADIVIFGERQLQSKFKHAAAFGVKGNFSKDNAQRFEAAQRTHVTSSKTQRFDATYRGNAVISYLDPESHLNVITDLDGNFISGWRLSDDQLWHLVNEGSLGGD